MSTSVKSPPRLATQTQVFVSFAPQDRELAKRVSSDLSRAGLKVVRIDQFRPRGEYSDAVRDALKKSSALVTVIGRISDRDQVPASVLFEIGAAVGAQKQIFIVIDEMAGKLPFNVPQLQVLPLNRAGEIATMLAV